LSEDEGEATSSSWLHGKEAWHDVVTSAGGEATSGKGKGGDDVSWANANLTGPNNEENARGRFNCYKWTVKI
jgi:hypothetical protein